MASIRNHGQLSARAWWIALVLDRHAGASPSATRSLSRHQVCRDRDLSAPDRGRDARRRRQSGSTLSSSRSEQPAPTRSIWRFPASVHFGVIQVQHFESGSFPPFPFPVRDLRMSQTEFLSCVRPASSLRPFVAEPAEIPGAAPRDAPACPESRARIAHVRPEDPVRELRERRRRSTPWSVISV